MVISCVKLVAHELPEDAATPPTDKILQSGVRVGAKAKEDLQAGLGLQDDLGAVEGVQPHTGHRLFHTSELRVGKHKASRDRTWRCTTSGRVVKLIAAMLFN